MKFEDIRTAITARMAAFTGIEQARIDYPNQPEIFAPPETGLWCRLNIQHANVFMAGMADRPYTRKPGRIVIQCFARVRTGMKGLNQLADALEGHFAYWTSGDIECLEASQAAVGTGDSVGNPTGTGFYQINVNIRFRAG